MIKQYRPSFFLLAASIALAISVGAFAQPSEPTVSSSTVFTPTDERQGQVVTMEATVTKVDQKTRDITLRGPKGKEIAVKAGPDVKNLAQLEVGDTVTLKYLRAAALEILPADSAPLGKQEQGDSMTAGAGEKPGAVAGHSVSITAKLTAIDMKNHTVTLAGADGKPHVIEVKDPKLQARMANLKVGELVRITYAEALGITVSAKD